MTVLRVPVLTGTHMSGIMLSMKELTEGQAGVLAAVRFRVSRGQLPPSYRDLCAEFGWSSTGTARDHLKALERKGYVRLPRCRGGRVTLCDRPPLTAVAPIIGHVAAGTPVMSEERREEQLPYPVEWSRSGDCFALKVTGESMVNAGILEGDHVIVRPQKTARSGQIVAATIDGETTLKRFVKNGSRILLAAENPRYEAIRVKTESVVIHGIVVGLIRTYQALPTEGTR